MDAAWMAGGGAKPGVVWGETDEFSYNITRDPVHVRDFQATILHQLGLDHERLTYRYAGRDFRLTDVHGHVVKAILLTNRFRLALALGERPNVINAMGLVGMEQDASTACGPCGSSVGTGQGLKMRPLFVGEKNLGLQRGVHAVDLHAEPW